MRPAGDGELAMLPLVVEAGLHFLRLLEAQAPSKSYRAVFIARFALAPLVGAALDAADEATRGFMQAMAGRALDARRLAATLRAGGTAALLQDPALAMVCCILPGVWAGAGMASLIYVAALQALPPDYYEAAAIDGAGILSRIRHITYPQLLPLMVINFVGAFIAAFQGMGSIFLLTFGGPGDATNVLSLAIWKEAYNNLRFSTATTMAWFLGVALIGFTYLQIRILRKVEFRRANTN